MIEKIVNIYSLKLDNRKSSYIYSLKKNDDYLGFEYYILTKNKKEEPIIYEITDIITLLQSANISLTPINKNSPNPEYQMFLNELSIALNNQQIKKEKNRK